MFVGEAPTAECGAAVAEGAAVHGWFANPQDDGGADLGAKCAALSAAMARGAAAEANCADDDEGLTMLLAANPDTAGLAGVVTSCAQAAGMCGMVPEGLNPCPVTCGVCEPDGMGGGSDMDSGNMDSGMGGY